MNFSRNILCATLLVLSATTAHAASLYAVYTQGYILGVGGTADGGYGSTSGSVSDSGPSGSSYAVAATLGGSTYTPVLHAQAISVNPVNADDRVNTSAEAYQTYTSSIAQTITLNLSLHGVVTNDLFNSSYVQSDIEIKGGATHAVSDSYCSGGIYTFAGNYDGSYAYLCGSTLGSSKLFINNGDTTLTDSIVFDVTAGESFTVYGSLDASAYGGSADASHTLQMSFEDPTYLTPAVSAVPLPAAFWLFGSGLLALFGIGRAKLEK